MPACCPSPCAAPPGHVRSDARSVAFLPQKAVNSIERDENYVPHLRSDFKLPPEQRATTADYAEVFEETPLFTAVRMFVMQAMCVFSGRAHCSCP